MGDKAAKNAFTVGDGVLAELGFVDAPWRLPWSPGRLLFAGASGARLRSKSLPKACWIGPWPFGMAEVGGRAIGLIVAETVFLAVLVLAIVLWRF